MIYYDMYIPLMCKNSIQIPQVHLDHNYPYVDFVNFQAPPDDATLPLPTKCLFFYFNVNFMFVIFVIYYKVNTKINK